MFHIACVKYFYIFNNNLIREKSVWAMSMLSTIASPKKELALNAPPIGYSAERNNENLPARKLWNRSR
jgi:hypothetical protein